METQELCLLIQIVDREENMRQFEYMLSNLRFFVIYQLILQSHCQVFLTVLPHIFHDLHMKYNFYALRHVSEPGEWRC